MSDIKFECEINGQKANFILKQEDINIQRLCDIQYHKSYVQAMKDGLLPRASLEQLMKEKEIWTSIEEDKLHELQTELNGLVIKLESNKNLTEGMKIAQRIANLRSAVVLLYEARSSVFQNSCEFFADQVRREAYLAYATHAENGDKAFKNYEDFITQRDSPVALGAMQALVRFISNEFQKTLDQLPENKVMNQPAEQLVTEHKVVVSKPKRKRKAVEVST